jgi:hypothetical protein
VLTYHSIRCRFPEGIACPYINLETHERHPNERRISLENFLASALISINSY